MGTRSKLVLAALTATIVMSVAVSTASARRFSINAQGFRAIWSNLELEASGLNIRCPVTLEGSFHNTVIEKVSGALIGYTTNGQVNGPVCTGGSATILSATLPWHIRYDSFRGALPNITGIRIQLVGAGFRVDNGTVCLTLTRASEPAFGIINVEGAGAIRKIRTLTADESAGITLRGDFLCNFAGRGRFRSTAEVFQQNTTTRLLLQLVQ
jgi:hypothetical protein